jgi:hypothetical protein
MRADMAAAYLDYSDTAELIAAISRGEAPAPSSLRGKGRKREPVWNREILDRHLVPVTSSGEDRDNQQENLQSLV